MSDCIFCKIIKGEIPSYKIYEDEYTYAFLDIADDYMGHTLVVPKCHCVNTLDADKETLHHVIDTVRMLSKHYVQNCGVDGVDILNANNSEAEQTVMHLHYHILPRFAGDNMKLYPSYPNNQRNLAEIQQKLQKDIK